MNREYEQLSTEFLQWIIQKQDREIENYQKTIDQLRYAVKNARNSYEYHDEIIERVTEKLEELLNILKGEEQ